MNYVIKSVPNKQELKNALAFGARIFGGEPDFGYANYSDEMISISGDLLIFAKYDGEVVGIVFGHIEDNGNMTVGPVAVDERFRKQGVAREMMSLIEKRAKDHGVHLITLGAVETVDGFYAKLGYTGSLLIQSEHHSIEELLSLNTKYRQNVDFGSCEDEGGGYS
jgi:GNAT superfamily N-acetyltransferase